MSLHHDDPVPFIVGASRSGTTLLRLMLDAHPEMAIPPETHFIPQLTEIRGKDPAARDIFFGIMIDSPTWNDFEVNKGDFRAKIEKLDQFTVSAGIRCFYQSYAARFNKSRWGDKTPIYLQSIGKIHNLIPEAHFIHIIRDGRDVALSKRGLWFGPGSDIRAQARDWVKKINRAREEAARLRSCYLEIFYEDLVSDPVTTLEAICLFLKLPYSAAMLEYHKNAAERLSEIKDWYRYDGSLWVQRSDQLALHRLTSTPPTKERIGKWRSGMSMAEITEFEEVAHDLLLQLGYKLGGQKRFC